MGNFLLNEGPKWMAMIAWLAVNISLFIYYFIHYRYKDDYYYLIVLLGNALPFARASAGALNFCCMLILLPVCRNLISYIRGTCTCCKRNIRRQLDNALAFHKANAYMICVWTGVHYFAHTFNVEYMVMAHQTDNTTDSQLRNTLSNLETLVNPVDSKNAEPIIEAMKLIAGWSGVIITVALVLICSSSTEFIRRSYYEVFWYTHHLFVVFFAFLVIHGIQGVVRKQDNLDMHDPHNCSQSFADWGKPGHCPEPIFIKGSAKTWCWVVAPMALYALERLIRYIRSHQKVQYVKVASRPSRVFEIQMKKKNFKMESGQYVFLQCPAISKLEWHPFTLTSCSHDEYFSVHVRRVGDWTNALADALRVTGRAAEEEVDLAGLPPLSVDGPYGTATEDVFQYQVDVLVGAGIGVTPFASVLKEIWYRLCDPKFTMKLQKVYFFWICPEMEAFEWFQDLLKQLERKLTSTGREGMLDYNIYLTRGWNYKQAGNIASHENDEYDSITGLREKTRFGRPNWNDIFTQIKQHHPEVSVGVFLCGPEALSKTLSKMCNKHTCRDLRQTRFFFNKENF